jgi:transposase
MSVELSRKGMTRQLLWEEYAEAHPKNHYSYSRFTVLYRAWFKKQRISMRQIHRAGEKLFVDYAGLTLNIIDSERACSGKPNYATAVKPATSTTVLSMGYTKIQGKRPVNDGLSFSLFAGLDHMNV